MHKIIFLISSLMFVTLTISLIFFTIVVNLMAPNNKEQKPLKDSNYNRGNLLQNSSSSFLFFPSTNRSSPPHMSATRPPALHNLTPHDTTNQKFLLTYLEKHPIEYASLLKNFNDWLEKDTNNPLELFKEYYDPYIFNNLMQFYVYDGQEKIYTLKKDRVTENVGWEDVEKLKEKRANIKKSLYTIAIWQKLVDIWDNFKVMTKRTLFVPYLEIKAMEKEIDTALPAGLTFWQLKNLLISMEKMTTARNDQDKVTYIDKVTNYQMFTGYWQYSFNSETLGPFEELEQKNKKIFIDWIMNKEQTKLAIWAADDFSAFEKGSEIDEPNIIGNKLNLPWRIKYLLSGSSINEEENDIDYSKLKVSRGYLTLYYKESNLIRMRYHLTPMQSAESWTTYYWQVSTKSSENAEWSQWQGATKKQGDTVGWENWAENKWSENNRLYVASSEIPKPLSLI